MAKIWTQLKWKATNWPSKTMQAFGGVFTFSTLRLSFMHVVSPCAYGVTRVKAVAITHASFGHVFFLSWIWCSTSPSGLIAKTAVFFVAVKTHLSPPWACFAGDLFLAFPGPLQSILGPSVWCFELLVSEHTSFECVSMTECIRTPRSNQQNIHRSPFCWNHLLILFRQLWGCGVTVVCAVHQ